jgi:hypothetical protein
MEIARLYDGGVALAEVTTKESSKAPNLNVRLVLEEGVQMVEERGEATQTTVFNVPARVAQFTMGLN